jgi:CBS domain containing-hemolysin-like protein
MMILLLSEIVPKTIGAVFWRNLWPAAIWPLQAILVILWPFVWITRFLTGLITLKGSAAQIVSENEIVAAAKLSARGGEISHAEAEMIRNVVNLEEKTAEDLMTPRTVMLAMDGNRLISEVQSEAEGWQYTRIPIYDENADRLTGYVLRYEICGAKDKELNSTVKTLAKPIRFVSESMNALTLLNRMLTKREHIYAVVDQYGGVMGLISLEDVLEALVGKEIVDEKDDIVDTQAFAKTQGQAVINAVEPDDPEPPTE